MRKPGCIEPVIYFRYSDGRVVLAPYSDFPTPEGAIREGADTLSAVDRLQERLVAQERREWEQEAEQDADRFKTRIDEVRDRLYSRMTSSSTSEYEKEFIRLYLQLRNEKRAKYQQRWLERTAYLYAREFNLGNRRADSEEFNVERHEVKS
jgi:hypothetical protein